MNPVAVSAPRPTPAASTPIPEIQGRAPQSALVGRQVVTAGLVTAVRPFTERDGSQRFDAFIQDLAGDGDAATSDALLLRGTGVPTVKPGQLVTASGTVAELAGMTALLGSVEATGKQAALPNAVPVTPPADVQKAADYLERREGMYATVPDAVVTTATTGYGLLSVASARTLRGAKDYDRSRTGIHVGVSAEGGNRIQAATGARVDGISGPLSFQYGEFQVLQGPGKVVVGAAPAVPRMWGDIDGDGKILPADIDAIRERAGKPATSGLDPADLDGDGKVSGRDVNQARERGARITGAPSFTVTSANLENLFDTVDNPGTKDTIVTPAEYRAKLASVAESIATDMEAPSVIGIQEVENEGILQDLVQHPALKKFGYDFAFRTSGDPRGISTAVLFRKDQGITVGNVRQEQGSTKLQDKDGGGGNGTTSPLFSREPLLADVTVPGPEGSPDSSFTFVVNHFMSQYSPQGRPTEPWRIEQAQFIRDLTKRLRAEAPDRPVVVLGDLNDSDTSASIRLLTDHVNSPLVDLGQQFTPRGERYTYGYRGTVQAIDHILATPDLATRVAVAGVRHGNADAPTPPRDAPGPQKVTDHDFPYATFTFGAPVAGAAQAAAGASELA